MPENVRDSGRDPPGSLDLVGTASSLELGATTAYEVSPVLDTVVPDVFFQDSRHDYAGVGDELKIVAPRMPANAVILFHDWIDPQVRRAARDHLPTTAGWRFARIAGEDPQQLGVAWRRTSVSDGAL